MGVTAWHRRPYVPGPDGDEDGVVFLWLKSFARMRSACEPTEPRAIWERQRPIVMFLLARSRVEVLCDPESPETIWAFAATNPGVVHYACIKRLWADMRDAMLADLLRDHLGQPAKLTHACPDLMALSEQAWVDDPYCITRMAFGEAA